MDTVLWTLFTGSFLASTLLPGGSEILLGAIALESKYSLWTLLWVATLGNTLGGMTNWIIGYWVAAKYPPPIEKHPTAWRWIERWGVWSLLLSWLPIIGDGLCLLAGWMRMKAWAVVALMAVGKAVRYAVLLWVLM